MLRPVIIWGRFAAFCLNWGPFGCVNSMKWGAFRCLVHEFGGRFASLRNDLGFILHRRGSLSRELSVLAGAWSWQGRVSPPSRWEGKNAGPPSGAWVTREDGIGNEVSRGVRRGDSFSSASTTPPSPRRPPRDCGILHGSKDPLRHSACTFCNDFNFMRVSFCCLLQ